VKTVETGYLRSVLSRFIRKVGEDNLARIIEEKVVKLFRRKNAKDVDAMLDASFIARARCVPFINNEEIMKEEWRRLCEKEIIKYWASHRRARKENQQSKWVQVEKALIFAYADITNNWFLV
jgi:hypothetical protein